MDIIISDSYITGRLYVPIVMIIFLTVMIYFHRHHALKYLYLVNVFCYLAAIVTYFIITNHSAGEDLSPWIDVILFIWLIGIFGGYFLSILSLGAFVVEHAQRHTWARAIIGIAGALFIVLCIIGIYYILIGLKSLKSG